MRNRTVFLAFLVLIMSFAVTAHANLLLNSGFEDGPVSGGDSADYWTDIDQAGCEGWGAYSGSWGMVIYSWGTPAGTATVYQDVSITAGTTYDYTMWASTDAGTLTGNYYMKIQWYNSTTLIGETWQNISTTISDTWTELSLKAIALTGCDTARVMIIGDTASMVLKFDDVDFAEVSQAGVPEPATMLLLGFGGLAVLRRRKASLIC